MFAGYNKADFCKNSRKAPALFLTSLLLTFTPQCYLAVFLLGVQFSCLPEGPMRGLLSFRLACCSRNTHTPAPTVASPGELGWRSYLILCAG